MQPGAETCTYRYWPAQGHWPTHALRCCCYEWAHARDARACDCFGASGSLLFYTLNPSSNMVTVRAVPGSCPCPCCLPRGCACTCTWKAACQAALPRWLHPHRTNAHGTAGPCLAVQHVLAMAMHLLLLLLLIRTHPNSCQPCDAPLRRHTANT